MGSSESTRLTDDGQMKFSPTFCDGGRTVVYAVHDVPNRVSLVRFDLESGRKERLYPEMQVHQFDPAFSRDGRWHAYCRSSGSPQMLLIVRDRQEQAEAVFTPEGARSTARSSAKSSPRPSSSAPAPARARWSSRASSRSSPCCSRSAGC